MKRPLTYLKALFPWPVDKPNVPPRRERWFSKQKQILLRKVVPRDAKLVVELGSWYGDSTKWFLQHCPNATVVAVDTWLGSAEHLIKKRAVLKTLYETFLVNCWEHRSRLVPFRNTSLAALNFLSGLRLKPDVMYFDSDHSYWGLLAELETAQTLFPKAIFIGDDYTGGSILTSIAEFTRYQRFGQCRGWKVEHQHDSWHIVKESK